MIVAFSDVVVILMLEIVLVGGVFLLVFRFHGERGGPLISTFTPLLSLRSLTHGLQ